jgi:hypothetical protein
VSQPMLPPTGAKHPHCLHVPARRTPRLQPDGSSAAGATALGAEGWELVSVEPCTACGSSYLSTLYLHRPLP